MLPSESCFSQSLIVLGSICVTFRLLNSYKEPLTHMGSSRECVDVFSIWWDQLDLPVWETWTRMGCCPCLTWAYLPLVKQKKLKGKRLQLIYLQLCSILIQFCISNVCKRNHLQGSCKSGSQESDYDISFHLPGSPKRSQELSQVMVKHVSSWLRSGHFQIILCLYWRGMR